MGLDDGAELSLQTLRRAVVGPLDRIPVEECQQDLGLIGEPSGEAEDRGAEALLPKLLFELACAALGLGQPLGDARLVGELRVLGRLLGRLELAELGLGCIEPAILAEGGTPVQLPGDAVMAIFGAPRPSPDHARQAARAALDIQRRGQALGAQHPDWPRFRIGLNSGEALVGNIGSAEFRNFTAIGDTVNIAQRFQTLAEPGQVVAGPATASRLGDGATIEWLGETLVKGKADPIVPAVLVSMDEI